MGVPFHTLSNYDVLVDVAVNEGYIKEETVERLKQWKKDPRDESWIR